VDYFGTSVDRPTQQWAQPVTAGVHGVSSKKCQLEVVEYAQLKELADQTDVNENGKLSTAE